MRVVYNPLSLYQEVVLSDAQPAVEHNPNLEEHAEDHHPQMRLASDLAPNTSPDPVPIRPAVSASPESPSFAIENHIRSDVWQSLEYTPIIVVDSPGQPPAVTTSTPTSILPAASSPGAVHRGDVRQNIPKTSSLLQVAPVSTDEMAAIPAATGLQIMPAPGIPSSVQPDIIVTAGENASVPEARLSMSQPVAPQSDAVSRVSVELSAITGLTASIPATPTHLLNPTVHPADSITHNMAIPPTTSTVRVAGAGVSSLRDVSRPSTNSNPSRNDMSSGTSKSKGNGHEEPVGRLPGGFAVLIATAVLFVCTIMLYFYMRRRRRAKRKATPSGGRSILSSHSGAPSASTSKGEDKHFTAGTRHQRPVPDSGASFEEKYAMEKQTATSAVSGVSPEQSAGSQRSHGNIVAGEHGCGYNVLSTTNANVAAGMAAGSGGSPMRSAFGTAVSDIYDCVATGKRQGAQMEFTDQPTTGFTTIPARAAAKREAISFDHIKAQQSLPHSATYRNTYHEGRTRDGTQPEVVSVEYASGAILDTNLANPSIKASSSKSQTGIKIKPRRLVRDNKKRPDNAKLSKASVARPADDLKNKITVIHNEWATAPHYLQQLAPPHHGPQGLVAEIGQSLQPHNSSLPGHIPRRSRDRPHTEPPSPTTDGQHPNPRKSANFLSLVDSIESLSDTYQFAVRHKPPLGPFHVIEPHMPGLPDELRIRRGEEIYVMGEFADSWVLAINVSQTNECGMIPRRCLYFPSTKFMTSKARPDDAVSPDQDTATTH